MKYEIDMTRGPLFGKIFRFTVPVLLTNLLQLLYNAADIAVVGQFVNSNAVGAIGATSSLNNMMLNLFIGIGIGVNVVTAQLIGAGRKKEVSSMIATSVWMALIGGLLLTVVGWFFSGTFLSWMNTPPELIEDSTLYLKIFFLGAPASLIYNFLAAVLRAYGDTKRPLLFLMLSGMVNVGLNVVFVYFFRMAVDGVAYATIISQYLSAGLVLVTLLRMKDYCRLDRKQWKPDLQKAVAALKVGVPAGLYSIMFSIANVTIQSAANSFESAAVVNGLSAGTTIESFVYTAINSISVATISFVGQNMGARDLSRIRQSVRLSLYLALGTWAICCVIYFLFRHVFFGILLPGDEVAIRYGYTKGNNLILGYGLITFMEILNAALRGLNRQVTSMFCSIFFCCIPRLLWVFFVFYPTVPLLNDVNQSIFLLFLVYPVSFVLTSSVLFWIYRRTFKTLTREFDTEAVG